MTDTAMRSTKMAVFTEANRQDESIVAVLIQRDPATRTSKAIVQEFPGHNAPDPEAVALLKQAVDLANL